MNTQSPHLHSSGRRHHSGFTLIELMVAITLGIFLIGGLLMMVQSTRNAFGNQQLLAQLQDNERLVMTFMAEVVESTGYFPNPVLYVNTNVFTAPSGVFLTPGQAVFGTRNAAAPGDTVTIRYAALLNDNVFNCRGLTNKAVAPYDVFVNKFWVDNTNPNNPVLTCTVSSTVIAPTPVPLVNGVQSLSIQYGVKRSVTDTGSCADTYLFANQMILANDWNNVCSINVTIFFTNPLNPAGPPIQIQRVIATMNAAGVNS
jgi:type IV pilus assembly protein PilW